MLTLFEGADLTMEIEGRWLYPLFLLYCAGPDRGDTLFSPETPVRVTDPRIGRGAVFLYEAIGIARAEGDIVSDLAWETGVARGVELSRREGVPTLTCTTEELLQDVTDTGEAMAILTGRLAEEFYRDPGQFTSLRVLSETTATATVRRFLEHRER